MNVICRCKYHQFVYNSTIAIAIIVIDVYNFLDQIVYWITVNNVYILILCESLLIKFAKSSISSCADRSEGLTGYG